MNYLFIGSKKEKYEPFLINHDFKIYTIITRFKLLNALRKLLFKINLIEIWMLFKGVYSIKKSSMNKYIFLDNSYWLKTLLKLKKVKIGVFKVYYFNRITDSKFIKDLKDQGVEIYTYNLEDSKIYNINFYPQIFLGDQKSEELRVYDICFFGRDKGRAKDLNTFYKRLKTEGINAYFYILKDKETNIKSNIIYNDILDYKDVIEITKKSKVNLEITAKNQNGLTYRAVESLFLKQKLITNNKNIKEYEWYTRENIFILEGEIELEFEKIIEFLKSPYKEIDQKLIEIHKPENWIDFLLKSEKK